MRRKSDNNEILRGLSRMRRLIWKNYDLNVRIFNWQKEVWKILIVIVLGSANIQICFMSPLSRNVNLILRFCCLSPITTVFYCVYFFISKIITAIFALISITSELHFPTCHTLLSLQLSYIELPRLIASLYANNPRNITRFGRWIYHILIFDN